MLSYTVPGSAHPDKSQYSVLTELVLNIDAVISLSDQPNIRLFDRFISFQKKPVTLRLTLDTILQEDTMTPISRRSKYLA